MEAGIQVRPLPDKTIQRRGQVPRPLDNQDVFASAGAQKRTDQARHAPANNDRVTFGNHRATNRLSFIAKAQV
jgi:hypothetical protein